MLGVVGVLVLAGVLAAIFVAQRRRQVAKQQLEGRELTLRLLQPFFDDADDLETLLLPFGSVDFGPQSPCIASGGGGRVFQCTATSVLNRRTTLHQVCSFVRLFGWLVGWLVGWLGVWLVRCVSVWLCV